MSALLAETTPEMKPHEQDFVNLVNELMERMVDEELFTFVLVPGVESTNNLSERLQRNPAQDRKAGRTSKTAAGAHRRSVIVSVLESLRANLEEFTLPSVLNEVGRWMADGISLFRKQWEAVMGNSPVGAAGHRIAPRVRPTALLLGEIHRETRTFSLLTRYPSP